MLSKVACVPWWKFVESMVEANVGQVSIGRSGITGTRSIVFWRDSFALCLSLCRLKAMVEHSVQSWQPAGVTKQGNVSRAWPAISLGVSSNIPPPNARCLEAATENRDALFSV